MAIVRPENMDFSKQTFSAIIYGSPGMGKTTLALTERSLMRRNSASRP